MSTHKLRGGRGGDVLEEPVEGRVLHLEADDGGGRAGPLVGVVVEDSVAGRHEGAILVACSKRALQGSAPPNDAKVTP